MKYFTLILLLAWSTLSVAQKHPSTAGLPENIYSFTSESEAGSIISRITDAVGLKPNFIIRAGNVDNAAALVYKGNRYIIYNPVFILQISKAVNTDWAGISILAHEIGHHLNGHTLTGTGSVPVVELEADEFSGYVLRKMGASLRQAQAAMNILSSERASRTHPARNRRLASIEKGWRHANSQIASVSGEVSKPLPSSQSTTKRKTAKIQQYSFPKQYVFRNVHFYNVPAKQFHITVQSNLVYVNEKGYSVVGKLVKSKSGLLLTMGENAMTVSAAGIIYNRKNQRIGYIWKA